MLKKAVAFFRSKASFPERRRALFMHIHKTAGTSLVRAAGHHYGWDSVVAHGSYVGRRPEDLDGFDFVSGHFGFDFAKKIMDGRYSFTFLRCPIERVLSFYYFCRKRDPDELPIYRLARDHDLSSFIDLAYENELVRERVWNSQVWRLADGPGFHGRGIDEISPNELLKKALENSGKFSFIGFTETFSQDAEVISTALAFPKQVRPGRDNVTDGRIPAERHSTEIIRKIERITELDHELYQELWSKLKN